MLYESLLVARLNTGVYVPTITNHSGFLTRSASVCGSRRVSTLMFSASWISDAVRWRMKTGFPRHLMMTCLCLISPLSSFNSLNCDPTYVLALWDSGEVNLDLSHGQNISGSRHVDEEVCKESIVSPFVLYSFLHSLLILMRFLLSSSLNQLSF